MLLSFVLLNVSFLCQLTIFTFAYPVASTKMIDAVRSRGNFQLEKIVDCRFSNSQPTRLIFLPLPTARAINAFQPSDFMKLFCINNIE